MSSVDSVRAGTAAALPMVPIASDDSGVKLEIITDMATMPLSYIVFAAKNNSNAPLIRRGEIVVVNTGGAAITGGWYPVDGGLFLIEYNTPPSNGELYSRRSHEIVQTFVGHRGWYAGSLRRGVQEREIFCVDGPYRDEIALADKLIGQVVGLYRPTGTMQ